MKRLSPSIKRSALLAVSLVPMALSIACGDSKDPKKDGVKGVLNAVLPGDPNAANGAAPAGTATTLGPPPKVVKIEFTENDFVENDRSRDPFRSFAAGFVADAKKPSANQRKVTVGEYAIDELKLVGIIMSGDYPRAMLVDPNGKGWTLKRGDYVGKPDVVHVGGSSGTDYQLNWRVDRVRPTDLVLVREDPAQPGVPPATKVIPLHPEEARQEKL
ncbi:MAG: pilus assembly protein PilP [Polyangiaceae bacterium]